MAAIAPPESAKLICGMLCHDAETFVQVSDALTPRFGPIDIRSETIDFDFTHYYEKEMGAGLLRQFVAFENCIDPGTLADIKRFTNELEDRFAQNADVRRPINLDPGYVVLSRLILASAKNFAHRIYLRDGIYAEVTLLYRNHRWESLEWTFPDFASHCYDPFFTDARNRLREQQHKERVS